VFERGLGSLMAEGLGKRALVRIFYTCQSYLVHPLLNMPQLWYGKHAKVFVGGLGSPMVAYVWKSELLSRAFYTLLLGISLGVLDTQQCS